MKKTHFIRTTALLIAMILVVIAPLDVFATPRALIIHPVLSYEGTVACCEVDVSGNNMSDYIEVTMKLMFKGWCKERWEATGYGYVSMCEYEDVLVGSTYDLVIQVTFNGEVCTPVSVSGTC